MIAEPELQFTPASSYLRVRRTQAAGQTASGILLPEVAQRRPAEGTVTACGLGRRIAGSDGRSVVWQTVGDIVLFQPADFHEITDAFDGLVSAEKVVATIGTPGSDDEYIVPENDYVKIQPDATPAETRGGLILPEESRERAQRGVILDVGPGELRLSGALAGTRKTIHAILGLSETVELTGRTVWWAGAQKALEVGGGDPCLLVKASDLMFLEIPESE